MAAIPRLPTARYVGVLTAVVFLGLVIEAFVPGVRLPLTMAQVGFALLHGARRYGWRAQPTANLPSLSTSIPSTHPDSGHARSSRKSTPAGSQVGGQMRALRP